LLNELQRRHRIGVSLVSYRYRGMRVAARLIASSAL
jgi:hypothetical protein